MADGGSSTGLVKRLWYEDRGALLWLLSAALVPAELAFRAGVALRDTAYRNGLLRSRPASVPAVSVGNLTVGGTGKTPLVRWLVGELRRGGRTPGVLHGGYADDEPALHRRWYPDLPVVADRDRVRGARSAVAHGADVLVLDDGFQHRRIARDLDIVLVAAERWTDRPRMLPRGPYREPLEALQRADVVVVTRRTMEAGHAADVARSVHAAAGRPVAVAHLCPGGWLAPDGTPRAGAPRGECVAVAGIGAPEAFVRQLSGRDVDVADVLVFRDHHVYTARDADRIRDVSAGRPVITTAKDAVKLGPELADVDVWVLDQTVQFEEGEDVLLERLGDAT